MPSRALRTTVLMIGMATVVIAAVVIAIVIIGLLVGVRLPDSASGAPFARFEPPSGQTYLGVSTHLITTGVDGWDQAAGIPTHPALYGRYTTPDGPFQPILDEVATRPGITPIIHWNLPMSGGQITDGSHDAYLKAQAASAKAYGKPVFVRLDWEMNGSWSKGYAPPNTTPDQFIASWNHVVAVFRAAGVVNVAWVWCPNAGDYVDAAGTRYATALWYPGDSTVDWVGIDAYPQFGSDAAGNPPSGYTTGTDDLNAMANFAQAHNKPLMLGEWAPNLPNPDVASAVKVVFDWAERYPNTVKALVYFDFARAARDFRLSSHPVGAAVFRARTADRCRYLLDLTAPVTC